MPWYERFERMVPDSIKKNVCAYLLQRYLGQFFEEKLSRDQLTVDLCNGTGTVEKISLDVQALNKLGEEQNWPMEIVDGYIDKLYVSIPWTGILKEASFVEVEGLKITVQPKQRNESATSMFESMWNSMTSSMKLAEECAKQDNGSNVGAQNAQTFEGIELFAQTIDSILSRVKVKFTNTIIQIEHLPKDCNSGVGVVININLIEYLDEAGNDPPAEEATDLTKEDSSKAYLVQSFTTKNFSVHGVALSTVEFTNNARTFSRSVISQSYEKEKDDTVMTLLENVGFKLDENEDCADQDAQIENDESLHRHVILFAKLSSKLEIRVRLKQSEVLVGPKVSIEVNLGSIMMFLSPRQLHVLIELANGLASPDIEDTSNVAPRSKCTAKPMSSLDYERVEQELQQQLHPAHIFQVPGLQGARGWSASQLEESDSDENFVPMKNTVGSMYDSTFSGHSSSMDSSITSSMTSSTTDNRSYRRNHNIDTDPSAEISHFQIRLASLALILLHEDILTQAAEPSNDSVLVQSSVIQMQQIVESFFDKMGQFVLTAYGNKDFENARTVFDNASHLNHLRLLAAPVHIEGDEKTTLTAFSVTGQLTAAKLELLECIYENSKAPADCVSLISFVNVASVTAPSSLITAKPSLKLSFKHVERTSKGRRNVLPRTELNIGLNKCEMELDISIVDRITALLNPQPICIVQQTHYNPWNPINPPVDCQSESKLDLKIHSPEIKLKLRFPIPDFRPPHSREPWWKKNVRQDYIILALSDVAFDTSFQTTQSHQAYNIQSRALDIIYYESDSSPPMEIAKVIGDSKSVVQEPVRLNIKRFPVKKVDLEECCEPEQDPMTQSIYGAFENQTYKQPGPFSAKRIVHESDTPHSKPYKDDAEELIIPGDKHEMEDFIESCSCSQTIVEITLPVISIQLMSKHVYELIYNRINNDLLLWESSAPRLKANLINYSTNLNFDAVQERFTMCKNGNQFVESDSNSDDDSDQENNDTIFYSIYDKMRGSQRPPIPATAVNIANEQSDFVLNIQIGQGLLTMQTPVRDIGSNNVIPNQHGEFMLNIKNGGIFVVSGYKGDANLGFVCVQVHNAQLYHCDMITTPNYSQVMKEVGSPVAKHLHPTVYKSEVGMSVDKKDRGGLREMLTVAVRIQANHETHHVKTVRVAVGLNKATLRHNMCNEPNSWISHLLDFFNVQDYPIPGYLSKDVLTELHLHLWDCAIDYRPLHLPLRSAVVLGNFSMSSHLSAAANSSTLRFIAEECGLFLSEKGLPKNGIPSAAIVDLKRDYVNVIELGLFELSLKTNDKKSGINPHIDLRASNNIVNIHTCADSGRALMQLIIYFANDGDLECIDSTTTQQGSYSSGSFSSPLHQPVEQELINVEPQLISNLSKSQHQHVNDLLGEAMKETEMIFENEVAESPGAQLFYFPDENQVIQAQDALSNIKPLAQVTAELGDIALGSNKSSDTDDDFCFIGNEEGLGIFPKNGLPEIKWLTNDVVRVVDNHFSIPVGKTDLLKPPKHFPTPVMRYTLCEMSIVWHMYGGNDFKLSDDKDDKKKKTVNFSDMQIDERVTFSNKAKGEVIFTSAADRKKNNLSWIVKGGINRDHSVLMELQLNKVRFQHELYPESTKQASRQVLIISEIEIRDRLESSQINKFLYQYTSQAKPKQSHAQMIVIKALHIRPEPKLPTQECCLKISLLPLKLNIDQDSLLFLIAFFGDMGGDGKSRDDNAQQPSSKHNTPTHQPPVMTVNEQADAEAIKKEVQKCVNENLLILLEENKEEIQEDDNKTSLSTKSSNDSLPVYFRNIIFSPEVPIRLDYHGKRVDMSHGPLPGLLMGLGQLNCSELKLKRISHRHGLLGFDKLMQYLLQEWLNDIKKNQLPSLLGGVGPIHSLLQLFQGIKDLFWLPIEQYQKDGRIVRGLQRGANSFTTSTAMAALELTSRIIHLIQITAETAYDMLSPGPSVKRIAKSKGKRKRLYHQPQDIRQGVTNAILVVREGIGETADNIVQIAAHEKDQKGYSGAVGGVLRQLPSTMLAPIIIASEATSNVLGGMQSQLVPDARREANQKWRNSVE